MENKDKKNPENLHGMDLIDYQAKQTKKRVAIIIVIAVIVVAILSVFAVQYTKKQEAKEAAIAAVTGTDYAGRDYSKKTDQVVKDGDTVNIDYDGYINGKKVEGEFDHVTDQALEIGSNLFVEGFEDQLIGHNVGETVDVTIKFSDTYKTEYLQGKTVVFKVTINGIYPESELEKDK